MHFINHNFTDHDFETKHFNRIEKTVYLDLRSLYLSEEKPIDGSDMDLLQRRLSVIDDAEKQALAFILKDKFTSSKAGKQYNQPAWDKIIKDYKYQQVTTALSDMAKRLRAAGVTIEANAGMSAIRELYINRFGGDKLTRITNKANVMTNEANVKANRANDKANDMTNEGEYKLTSNDERRFMVDSLKGVDESVTLKTAISTLRELYTKRFNSDSKVDATNAIHQANDMTNTNAIPMTNRANDKANEINAENDAITTNHEPITSNQQERGTHSPDVTVDNLQTVDNSNVDNHSSAEQPVTKAEQIRSQRADDIESWQAPTIDDIRSKLMMAGKMMQLTDGQYEIHIDAFRAHYAQQALVGKPLVTESNRKAKFLKWMMSEADAQKVNNARQDKAKGTFNIDNEDWSSSASKRSSHDSDLPPVFHPSHSQPVHTKIDPSKVCVFNGLPKEPLPNMTISKTYEYVKQGKMPGESADETYDRLLNEFQEAV